MRGLYTNFLENTGLMRDLSAERHIFEKCRRFCRAGENFGRTGGVFGMVFAQ